jgi:hypothetical protein
LIHIYRNRLPQHLADAQDAMRDGNAGNGNATWDECRAALADDVSAVDAVLRTPR